MAYLPRLHVPGATYYVVQRGTAESPIFRHPEDCVLFETILASVLRRFRVRLYAYCFTSTAVHLAIQIRDLAVAKFMQRLTAEYSARINRQSGESAHFFRRRYSAVLIDRSAYLFGLVRYIHYMPVQDGQAPTRLDSYRLSSHAAYLGTVSVRWLTTSVLLRTLASEPDQARKKYAQSMAVAPSLGEARLFECGCPADPRVVGDAQFLSSLRPLVRVARQTCLTLPEIVEAVTQSLGVDPVLLISRSRKREFTLARAVITWHAIDHGAGTLREIACRLKRQPSSLCAAIAHYRRVRPDLFEPRVLEGLVRPITRADTGDASSLRCVYRVRRGS